MPEKRDRLEVGDLAQLKSGGPEMTVVDDSQIVGNEPAVECEWFDNHHKSQSKVYPMKALVRVERDSAKK